MNAAIESRITTTVHLPYALAQHVGQSHIELQGATLKDVLERLTNELELGDAVLAADGELQPYVWVVIDGLSFAGVTRAQMRVLPTQGKEVVLKTAIACG